MLNIGIDFRPMLDEAESGVKVYTREMFCALSRLPCKLEPFYFQKKEDPLLSQAYPSLLYESRYNALDILSYPYFRAKPLKAFDLIWYPDRRPSLHFKGPQVMTIHDFCPEKYQDSLSLKSKLFHAKVSLERLKKQMDFFVVPSQTIADEAKFYGLHTELVLEACPTVTKLIRQPEKGSFFTIMSADERKGWQDLYWLATCFPSKRFHVFAGPTLDARFKKKSFPKVENIIFERDLSQQNKEKILSKCEAFISFTNYEGFNLPILEAEAMQTPVLMRDIPLHRELYREASFFSTKENLYHAIEHSVFSVPKLRQDLSWKASAEKLLLLFERIVHNKNR